MNLYLIKRTDAISNYVRFGKFGVLIVCAENDREARLIHPRANEGVRWDESLRYWVNPPEPWMHPHATDWCDDIDSLDVQLIGHAAEGLSLGVVHACYMTDENGEPL